MSEAPRSNAKQPCLGIRTDGSPCQTRVLVDGAYCFAHAPGRDAERAEARQRGGKGRNSAARVDKLVPASLKPTIALLFTALEETHAGTLDPRQAGAMAALAGAISRLYASGVLEERLAALHRRGRGDGGQPRMSAFDRRLDALEAQPRRCATCQDRQGHIVVYDDQPPPHVSIDPCPRCGWEPLVISVVHVDGAEWHQRGGGMRP